MITASPLALPEVVSTGTCHLSSAVEYGLTRIRPAAPTGLGDPASGIGGPSTARSSQTTSIPSSAGITPSASGSPAPSGAASFTRSIGGGDGEGGDDTPNAGTAEYGIHPLYLLIAAGAAMVISQ